LAAFQAQYSQQTWLAAVRPVENTLRQARRDALEQDYKRLNQNGDSPI
jgi:hypothetical protein